MLLLLDKMYLQQRIEKLRQKIIKKRLGNYMKKRLRRKIKNSIMK